MSAKYSGFLQIFILLISFVIINRSNSQLQVEDSIKKIIQQSKTDTQKVNLLNKYAEVIADQNAGQSILLADEALQLAKKINYIEGYGRALNNKGFGHYRKGDYTIAFEYSTKALKWNDSIQNQQQLAASYRNIAAVYYSQANYIKAIEFLKKELDYYRRTNNKKATGRALNNLAFNSFRAGFINDAKTYIQEAILLSRLIKDNYLISLSHRTLGDIAVSEKKTDSAIYYYEVAIMYAKKAKSAFAAETALYRLGRIYVNSKEYKKALPFLEEALAEALGLNAKSETALIYQLIARAYEGMGDYKNAYAAQQKNSVLNDTIYQDKGRTKLAELQAQFGAERKQVEINALIKEKAERIERVKQQTVLNISLGITVVVSIIMLLVIWRRNKYKQLTNKILTAQKKSLEETSVLKDKIFSIISHDLRSPIGSLSEVLPMLEPDSLDYETYQTLKNSLSKQVKSLTITLDNLLVWARTQMKGVTPPVKVIFNLYPLIYNNTTILMSMADQKRISLFNEVAQDCSVYADKQQIDIIVRNLLLNAFKFTYENGKVTIKTIETTDQVILTVTDNGMGMTEEQVGRLFQLKTHFTTPGTQKEKGTGLGLLVCAEYATANNCTLKVESEPQKGTTISLILPKFSA